MGAVTETEPDCPHHHYTCSCHNVRRAPPRGRGRGAAAAGPRAAGPGPGARPPARHKVFLMAFYLFFILEYWYIGIAYWGFRSCYCVLA